MAAILARLAGAFAVIAGVAVVVFALLHAVPGDPVEVMLGEHASSADRAALTRALGLDRPLPVQFADYLARLARGDLGASLYSRVPVAELIAQRLPYTAALALLALAIAVIIALPAGIAAALRPDSALDRIVMGLAVLGGAIPNFWLGPLLILVFALWLGLLPVSGSDTPWHIVLPALTLGGSLAAILARMTRSTMLEVLDQDYLRTARAAGLHPARVILRHALPNCALPIVTVLGLQLGALLGGAVITEVIFVWPGIGQLTIEAIERRDYPVVQGSVLLISTLYVLVNLLTDLCYYALDPRVGQRA